MNNSFTEKNKDTNKNILSNKTLLKENIEESNKITKKLLNIIILLGALGFLIVGISSYIKFNIIPFLDANQIIFFPQGLTMCFYGSIGLILSINQILIQELQIGEGFNEFDKKNGTIRIFRKGFPGKNVDVNILLPLEDVVRTNRLFN